MAVPFPRCSIVQVKPPPIALFIKKYTLKRKVVRAGKKQEDEENTPQTSPGTPAEPEKESEEKESAEDLTRTNSEEKVREEMQKESVEVPELPSNSVSGPNSSK